VHVLEDEHQRLAGGDLLEQLRHALEQRQGAVAGRRQAGNAGLRKQPGQLGPPRGVDSSEQPIVGAEPAAAAEIDPGREREDRVALVAATDQYPTALRQRLRGQRADEPRLADPGFTRHRHDAPLTSDHLLEALLEPGDVRLAPEQRRPRRGQLEGRRLAFGHRAGARILPDIRDVGRLCGLPQQLLVQRLRLSLGLGAQLSLQTVDAQLVLLERRRPAPLPRVELHQGAVHGLLQRIEREQPQRRPDGAFRAGGPGLVGQEPGQGLQRNLAEPLALGHQPVLEQRLGRSEAEEQVAPIERRRLLQRLGRPFRGAALEGHQVDRDALRIE
jgi:hypothetical protein